MRVLVIEAPVPVVDLAEARDHLRVDGGLEDALITGMVAAATGDAEAFTQQVFAPRLLEARFDAFETARCVRLPSPPVIEIVAFTWRGSDGTWHEGDLIDIELDGRDVVPTAEAPWTGMAVGPGSLRITYRAGYEDVPDQVRSAILLMTGFLYHNRGAETAEPPAAVAALLQPFRVYA